MSSIIQNIIREMILFFIGGIAYVIVELLFRGYSHYSMFIVGGLCFVIIGIINEFFTWKIPLVSQMLISALIITVLEFISGCIVNLALGLEVWDYSNQPYNLFGQICLLFSNIWFIFSIVPIVLDDYIRYWFFNDEKPRYKLFM